MLRFVFVFVFVGTFICKSHGFEDILIGLEVYFKMTFIMIKLCPMKGSAIISLSYSLTNINYSISAEEKDSANLWPISVCRD